MVARSLAVGASVRVFDPEAVSFDSPGCGFGCRALSGRGAATECSRGRQPAEKRGKTLQSRGAAAENRRPASVAAPRLRIVLRTITAGWRPRLHSDRRSAAARQTHNIKLCGYWIVAAVAFQCAAAASAADGPPLTMRAVEAWSGVFGGEETEFHFEITSIAKVEVRASWSLAVEGAVLARRETTVAVAPGKPGTLSAPFKLPDAREGIVVPLDLTVGVESGGDSATFEKRLWLFPDDPFALKKDWLHDLKIALFDPAGETAQRFTDAKVPFERIRTVDQAAALRDGVLVIGEGLSWTKQRALPPIALDLASQGVAVLALAPSDGSLSLPGSDAENVPLPKSLLFRRGDIISELDKRLDAVAWPPDGTLQVSGLQIRADRARVMAHVVDGKDGWPWFECHFAAPHGRLLVCGFPVVQNWESGPTPRYLFAHMLERLVDADKQPPDDDEARRQGLNPIESAGEQRGGNPTR